MVRFWKKHSEPTGRLIPSTPLRVPRVIPGPGQFFYLAIGVELGFMALLFFFVFFFFFFIDFATGVLAGDELSANTGPDTATRKKTVTSDAINFFIPTPLIKI